MDMQTVRINLLNLEYEGGMECSWVRTHKPPPCLLPEEVRDGPALEDSIQEGWDTLREYKLVMNAWAAHAWFKIIIWELWPVMNSEIN